MNILHLKYAVEVARVGSLNRAAENLIIAQPNLSRSIKELESDLGITIFERTPKGMRPTAQGEEFIGYAKELLRHIDQVELMYKDDRPIKKRFSVSVPRASYISEAFTEFSKSVDAEAYELFYKETNSKRTINNLVDSDYTLGIIRYAENYDSYFKAMLEEKGLKYELIAEFSYKLIMSEKNPLAKKEHIRFCDLEPFIEIAHADPYVPSLSLAKVVKDELPDNINRRIFVFERGSQMDLLASNHQTFMWVSPTSDKALRRYGLIQRECDENRKIYKDMLIYKKGYQLSALDKKFISEIVSAKRKYLTH